MAECWAKRGGGLGVVVVELVGRIALNVLGDTPPAEATRADAGIVDAVAGLNFGLP